MARPGRLPDFRRMYPKASEEVIRLLKSTERKMQYQEYDLKAERPAPGPKGLSAAAVPGREDSLERLAAGNARFEGGESAEDMVIRRMEAMRLYTALSRLPDDERWLMERIYFQERTEREIAKELGVCHNAVHKKKLRILGKLKNILEKI